LKGDGESGKFGDKEKEESRWLRKFMKVRENCFCIFSPKYIRLGLKEHKHEAHVRSNCSTVFVKGF
jgi:hypothetical protein